MEPKQKIAFPYSGGLVFVDPDEIVHCVSDGNYSTLYFRSDKELIVCRQLIHLEKMLPAGKFLRVHYRHLVGIDHIVRFFHKNNQLLLSTGIKVPVAKRRKKEIIGRFPVI